MLGGTRNKTASKAGRPWCGIGHLRPSAGFTLVELIIITVMAGVLAATVSMKSGWLISGYNLKMAIDQVAGDLQFLRAKAMATYTDRGGTFPTGGTAYNLDGQVKSLPSGVTISSGLTVTFNSLGEYPPSWWPTPADTTLILQSGTLVSNIIIHAISGDVEAY
jgi:hypothetical protein